MEGQTLPIYLTFRQITFLGPDSEELSEIREELEETVFLSSIIEATVGTLNLHSVIFKGFTL